MCQRLLNGKADKSTTYTKTHIESALAVKLINQRHIRTSKLDQHYQGNIQILNQ